MGKAFRWFRSLLGLKKSEYTSPDQKSSKEKRRWSFVKSYREQQQQQHNNYLTFDNNNNNKQAIAVAASTAAAAEAAVAAALDAAAVVRFNSSNRLREECAAVKIQAAFRGSLARKALRALKGLVKLQALVRGHIERKRTTEWLKRMQSLLRAQAQFNAARTLQSPHLNAKSFALNPHGPVTPEKYESPIRSRSMKSEHSPALKRNVSKSCLSFSGNVSENQLDEQSLNRVRSLIRTYNRSDEKNDRIVEIDSGKQHITAKRRNLFHSTSEVDHYYSQHLTPTKESKSHQSVQSQSCEVQSYYNPLKLNEVEENSFYTAINSPQILSSATSQDDGYKRSPFTPTKSDGSRNRLRGYTDYPSYMSYTESSKAKVRSLSAPKQRLQYERSGSCNRYSSLNGHDMVKLATHRNSALQASFSSKGYPGSGRMDKLGMAVRYKY